MDFESLTGAEKVAIVILSMPDQLVDHFLAELDDDEVQKALSAISRNLVTGMNGTRSLRRKSNNKCTV